MSAFADRLIYWHHQHGRHDLPWQNTRDPYRIWLSEIMLQQTQVETVIPYYARFLARFPDLATLAGAPVDDVMSVWSGLGYYARARNLHACAKQITADHDGRFPDTAERIATLPGIGRSTAAAIAVFAFGRRAAILDGNVKRVLCRVFGIDGFPGQAAVEKQLWALAESLLPAKENDTYIQAQMDLGATICVRGTPRCERCPMRDMCVAFAEDRCDSLPSPKPRKPTPRRSATLAVVTDGRSVLLLKRPSSGIWGGLLSLPEIDADTRPEDWWEAHATGQSAALDTLPPLRHTFTHFTLDIQPIRVAVAAIDDITLDAAQSVHPLNTLNELGLPAPIRKILEALQATGGTSKPR